MIGFRRERTCRRASAWRVKQPLPGRLETREVVEGVGAEVGVGQEADLVGRRATASGRPHRLATGPGVLGRLRRRPGCAGLGQGERLGQVAEAAEVREVALDRDVPVEHGDQLIRGIGQGEETLHHLPVAEVHDDVGGGRAPSAGILPAHRHQTTGESGPDAKLPVAGAEEKGGLEEALRPARSLLHESQAVARAQPETEGHQPEGQSGLEDSLEALESRMRLHDVGASLRTAFEDMLCADGLSEHR